MSSLRLRWCWLLVAASLLELVTSVAQADQSPADELRAAFSKGEQLRAQGKSAEAIPYHEKALRLAGGVFGADAADTATIQLGLANLYRDVSRYADAEPLYKRCLQNREARLGQNHPDVAQVVNSLANLYWYTGKYAEALPLYERNLRIVESRLGPDHLDVASALSNLAMLQTRLGKHALAEPLYRRSLQIKEVKLGKDHPGVAHTLNNLAELYRATNRNTEAIAVLQRSLQIWEAKLGKDHPDVARSLSDLGNLNASMGKYSEAEPLFLRSLEIREARLGQNHPDVAQSLINLAGLYIQTGDYPQAEARLQRSLKITEARLGNQHPDVAAALANLGDLYKIMGQFSTAEPLLQRSLQIYETNFGANHPDVANALVSLADLYNGVNAYDKSEPLLKRSLRIREVALGKEHTSYAATQVELGECYNGLGRYAEAEPLFLNSLRIYEAKLGKDHPSVASNLNGLGTVYWNLGQLARAEQMYLRSLQIREARLAADHPQIARMLNNLAVLYAARERWNESAAAMGRMRRVTRRHVNRVLPIFSEREQMTFLQSTDEPFFRNARSLGLQRRNDPATVQQSANWVLNGKAVAQQSLAEQAMRAQDSKDAAVALVTKGLAQIRRQLSSLFLAPDKPEQARQRRELLTRLQEQELAASKKLAQITGRPVREDPWVELDEVRKALPPDGVLIEISRFENINFKAKGSENAGLGMRYAAWIIPPAGRGNVQLIDLGAAAPIDAAVKEVRKSMHAAPATIAAMGEADAEKELRKSLASLSELILNPLKPSIQNQSNWIISPDGALWLVPWAALPWDDGYVVEKHQVHYVISGRDLVLKVTAKTQLNMPLVMADPDFDLGLPEGQAETRQLLRGAADQTTFRASPGSLGNHAWQRLPGTAAEAKAISPSLQKYAKQEPRVYLSKYALEGVFKSFASPQILVLSTHGFFLEDQRDTNSASPAFTSDSVHGPASRAGKPVENPLLRCGLVLAGANHHGQGADRRLEDGVLTGLEIAGTNLRGTELVVLSACETGLGQINNSEGVAGVRQAFQLAGAESVLATLWQIPDRETTRLMARFFEKLADGKNRSLALAEAQREMIRIRRVTGYAAHPFYWAAFTLTGRDRAAPRF